MTHGYFCLIEMGSLRQWGHAIIFSKACSHYDVIVSRVTIISLHFCCSETVSPCTDVTSKVGSSCDWRYLINNLGLRNSRC